MCVSVHIGPQEDGYRPGVKSAERAARYHRLLRIAAAKEGGTDFVSAYTISSTGEAVVIAISTWQSAFLQSCLMS